MGQTLKVKEGGTTTEVFEPFEVLEVFDWRNLFSEDPRNLSLAVLVAVALAIQSVLGVKAAPVAKAVAVASTQTIQAGLGLAAEGLIPTVKNLWQ